MFFVLEFLEHGFCAKGFVCTFFYKRFRQKKLCKTSGLWMIRRDVDGWWWEEGQSYLNSPISTNLLKKSANNLVHLIWVQIANPIWVSKTYQPNLLFNKFSTISPKGDDLSYAKVEVVRNCAINVCIIYILFIHHASASNIRHRSPMTGKFRRSNLGMVISLGNPWECMGSHGNVGIMNLGIKK